MAKEPKTTVINVTAPVEGRTFTVAETKDIKPDEIVVTAPVKSTPAPASAAPVYDFTAGEPDQRLDGRKWQIYMILSRQHKNAEPEKRDAEFPHPKGRSFTLAELAARGVDPDALPQVPPRCCGK